MERFLLFTGGDDSPIHQAVSTAAIGEAGVTRGLWLQLLTQASLTPPQREFGVPLYNITSVKIWACYLAFTAWGWGKAMLGVFFVCFFLWCLARIGQLLSKCFLSY